MGRHSTPARQAVSRTETISSTSAQRASVGSTEAAKDAVARVGVIDRRIGEPPCARPKSS
jgi:hypothetical protein